MGGRGQWLRVVGWVVALACAVACGNPHLVVVVTLPDATDRSQLTVALTIYAPAALRGVACDQLVAEPAMLEGLRGDRVYSKVLLTSQDGVADIRDGVAPVPCEGDKIIHALGDYDVAGGTEIDPRAAALVGCKIVGEIDGDMHVTVPVAATGN